MNSNQPNESKQAKMGLHEPKWAQMTINMFKMILYELKMGLNELKMGPNKCKSAQISLDIGPNNPKLAGKSLNELEWALMSSHFNKIFTSDAYQCKTWHMLRFLKLRNKCRKQWQKSVVVAHFHKSFVPRPLTSFDLRPKFCVK